MRATSLTNPIRQAILKRLLDHAFKEREDALYALKCAFAKGVYNDVYPEALRATMEALPEEMLPKESYLNLVFDGSHTRIHLGEPRLVSNRHRRSVAKQYCWGHPFISRFRELKDMEDTLHTERCRAKDAAMASLTCCRTVNKLIQIWPEVEPFARDLMTHPSQALMIPVKELNKAFSLPVEEKP